MNLGVDLGSTYSSFSTYDIVNKNVESVSYTHLDVYKRQSWYRKAAEQGFATAQYNLCLLYTSASVRRRTIVRPCIGIA